MNNVNLYILGLASGRSTRYHDAQGFHDVYSSTMLNLITSTIVFFIAAWFANRYLDNLEITRSRTRGVLVFVLSSLVSWGAGEMADRAQAKVEGTQASTQTSGDLSKTLKAAGQSQP